MITRKLPSAKECIAYIETTDYKLAAKGKLFKTWGPNKYVFRSQNRPDPFKEIVFTLPELRRVMHIIMGFENKP